MADEVHDEGIRPDETDWIVIRPEGHIAGSELPSPFEGQWRRRSDLDGAEFVEFEGPQGVVRAHPTDRLERSAAGDIAQVWQVPGDTGVADGSFGLDDPHRDRSEDDT